VIRIDIADGIAEIVIDAQSKGNSLDAREKGELAAAFNDCGTRADVRAVVLTGRGERFFCAGSDIKEMHGFDVQAMRDMLAEERRLYVAAMNCPKPIVAAVNGYALGTGFILTLVSDYVVADPAARFGVPELAIGVATPLEALLLPWFVGLGRARALFYMADHLEAGQAHHYGLVQEVATAGGSVVRARQVAAKIGGWPADGFAVQKRMLTKHAMTGDLVAMIDETLYAAALQYANPDVLAAIEAFVERRK
jgi:enoyl-CoA hydratase